MSTPVRHDQRPSALAVLGRGVVDPETPVIHADDLGLLRGQAAFETVRVYGGRPFALVEHVERLGSSARRIGLPGVGAADLRGLAEAAIAAAGLADCSLRFTYTGGRAGAGAPVVMASVSPLPVELEETRARGIAVVSLPLGVDPDVRRDAPWLLSGVKSTSYAVNMAAWAEARRRGADDAVFLATDGTVLEGPVTNIWWRRGAVLRTPALELGILAGVTRAHVLTLAARRAYRVEEGRYGLGELVGADEAFTSSSVREIMPVVSVDGHALGDGRPGEAASALQADLRAEAGAAL